MINKDDIHKKLRKGITWYRGWTEEEFLTTDPHYASVHDIDWDVSDVGPIRPNVLNTYISHIPDFDFQQFPIFTSNTYLPWWALAATFEVTSLQISWIQTRKQSTWIHRLLRYELEEVLSHEIVHLLRVPLSSTRYEEVIAYMVHGQRYRRYLGPICSQPWFVALLTVVSIMPVCLIFISGGYLLEWLIFIFLSMLISMFVGVGLSMLKIRRVYLLIGQFVRHGYSSNEARYIIHHLDDHDIDMFSDHIDTYFQYRNNVDKRQKYLNIEHTDYIRMNYILDSAQKNADDE
ncbi:hypothetical protein N9N03_01685 [Chlamydiia bacterium]|nr:hypothetical protein [Chlamydiia bacterium]